MHSRSITFIICSQMQSSNIHPEAGGLQRGRDGFAGEVDVFHITKFSMYS